MQADVVFQGAFAGGLDDRAICHGIGKRHTDLDQVGSGLDQCMHQRYRDAGLRITCRDIGDQRLATAAFQVCEALFNTAHICIPSMRAMVATSLSPRPERLTTMVWSGCIRAASFEV